MDLFFILDIFKKQVEDTEAKSDTTSRVVPNDNSPNEGQCGC
jgi:hypothetical protein